MTLSSAPPLSPRDVLAQSAFFGSLPPAALEQLAPALQRQEIPAGNIVVWEGEPGDCYYLIASGAVDVWAAKGKPGERPSEAHWTPDARRFRLVGRLEQGTGFGEMALLLGGARRATIWAATDLVLYSVDRAAFTHLLNEYRGVALALEEEMTLRAVATAAGRTSPFASLSPDVLRWLALRLQRQSYGAGADIVRQGEPGDALYIIQSGKVEVLGTRPDGTTHQLVTLGPGQPFGEQALVSDEPRNATVRTTSDVEVFRLSRDDFESVLRDHPDRSNYFQQLSLQRQRPQPVAHCRLERQEEDGKTVFILKDAHHGRYLRISEEAAFLWELMDGERTVRDLALAYYTRYKAFGIDAVMDVMLQLHEAGFIHIQRVDRHGHAEHAEHGTWQRLKERITPWISHNISFGDVDPGLTRIYRLAARPLYTRIVQLLLLLGTLVGAVLYVMTLLHGGIEAEESVAGKYIAIAALIVGLALQLSLHELSHAITTKHFDREVHHAGIGWYLVLPIIWVDTSDMWVAKTRDRILVALAGPYTNFLLSGMAMLLIGFVVGDRFVQSLLFEFASAGYVLGILNLNPLMEFDGYFALSDWLDIPNLRAKALSYLGSVVWRAKRTTRDPRLRRIFTAYGTLALAYTVFIAVAVLRGYEATIEGLVTRILPALAAGALGWGVAGAMCWLILRKAYADLLEWKRGEA